MISVMDSPVITLRYIIVNFLYFVRVGFLQQPTINLPELLAD